MTENEAIERIKDHMKIHKLNEPRAIYITVALSMAITALKEIQQYREIGTVEECREGAEKQKPKKPEKVTNSSIRHTDDYICPNCGKHFTGTGIAEYCYHCGQAIQWNLEGEAEIHEGE